MIITKSNITKSDAIKGLKKFVKHGCHIDDRVYTAIEKSNNLSRLTFLTKESYLSLVWQAHDDSRILTPKSQPRTLRHVVERMNQHDYSFHSLSDSQQKFEGQYNPEWFNKCRDIEECFDRSKFGWLVLTELNENEKKESPEGSYYIYDGVHRSLVLAKRLFKVDSEFQPIDALLILPRP